MMRKSPARPDVERFCVLQSHSIREATARIDSNRNGIVLVVDRQRHLKGTVTDGDIRRAVLARVNFSRPVKILLNKKKGTQYRRPITAPKNTSRKKCLTLLKKHSLQHLPLIDEKGRVTDLLTLGDLVSDRSLPLRAVIMAGGEGRRLYPLTKNTPKPMLQVGKKPLMEIIIRQLSDAGIRRVHITTHHKKEKISEHFGDGKSFGVDLSYVNEDRPLGTAGGLSMIGSINDPLLVINGDILTQMDFRAMLAYHKEMRSDLTVGVRQYDIQVPYGVVECKGVRIQRIKEKPKIDFFINAGVYLLSPIARRHIRAGEHQHMTDLIRRMLRNRRRVISFPIREYWLDIGQHKNYAHAQKQVLAWENGSKEKSRKRHSKS